MVSINKIVFNHNNVNYTLNCLRIKEVGKDTTLNQHVEKNNIIGNDKMNLTIELDENDKNYIIQLNKSKYLINKKNTVITFINLATKQILSYNNKDYFKLENVNYMLGNNSTLIIPLEPKKYFDNSNGMTYNILVPK